MGRSLSEEVEVLASSLSLLAFQSKLLVSLKSLLASQETMSSRYWKLKTSSSTSQVDHRI